MSYPDGRVVVFGDRPEEPNVQLFLGPLTTAVYPGSWRLGGSGFRSGIGGLLGLELGISVRRELLPRSDVRVVALRYEDDPRGP